MKPFVYVTLIAVAFAGAFFVSAWATAHDSVDSPFSDTPLLASSRDVLSVCVDGVPADVVRKVLKDIESELLAIPREPATWLADARVVEGCPRGRALTGEAAGRHGNPRPVQDASPHRLFVYLASEEAVRTAFARDSYGVAAEELLCYGDSCAEVTTGVYLTNVGRQTVKEALVSALGLVALQVPQDAELPTPPVEPRDPDVEATREAGG